MKSRIVGVLGLLLILTANAVRAEEPYLQFIQAMRQRYYFDYAQLYIDELRQSPEVPDDVKQVLPYEEYQLHQASARIARTSDAKEAALEKALAALEKFVQQAPNHPLAAEADSQRAGIYLDKAKALIWDSRSEKNVRKKADQQKEARDWIAKARTVFSDAEKKYEAAYEVFKGEFIDEKVQPDRYAEREKAMQNFVFAKYQVALCTYQEARTYNEESEEYKKLLLTASELFEAIHSQYRSQGGGLYSRLMQAKCLEEMGKLGTALGLYDELLGHPGTSPTMMELKAQTTYFKFIVLNKPEQHDYKLVVSEATLWLEANKKLAKKTMGLGIQFERARALEILGGLPETTEEEKNDYLQQAYNDAQDIALYAGEFRDPATSMSQRLESFVKEGGGDPKTFDTAFTQAKIRTKKLKDYNEAVANATSPDAKKLAQVEFDLQLKEAERMIRLALKLADEDSKPEDVATCRYFLAYTLFQARKLLDAATVGEYVVLTATEDQAVAAQDAAYLALGALSQIYNHAPKGNRDEEREMMARAAELLAQRWPESARADDAHLILGDVHRNASDPLKAAEYFAKVNATYERYPEALLKGGQAMWVAYLTALEKPADQRPEQTVLDQWVKDAVTKIEDGLKRIEQNLSKEGTPPDIYFASKVSLAEIYNFQNKGKEALQMLLDGDHSVIARIAIDDETQRPDSGPQSRPFAIQAYQLLLRSYMGTEAIDEAIATMKDLERVAGSENPEALTNIYIQLGVKLREEIERLNAEGDRSRLDSLEKAFDRFLGALAEREEGLNSNTLFWISESYANLGSGMKNDRTKAARYFENAGRAYQKILDEAAKDSSFLDAKKIPAIKIRIAVLQRRQGLYEEALKKFEEVLKDNMRLMDAQFEAALTYKEWATESGNPDKYLDAINGNKREGNKESSIYGFNQLATFYRNTLMNLEKKNTDLETTFYEVLYEITDCQYLYGSKQTDQTKYKQDMEKAKNTCNSFALFSHGDVDVELKNKFNDLYGKILVGLGEPVAKIEFPIEKPIIELPPPKPPVKGPTIADDGVGDPPPPPPPPPLNWTMITIGIVIAIVLGIGFYFVMKPKKGRKIRGIAEAPESITLPPMAHQPSELFGTPPARPKPRPAQKPQPANKPQPAEGQPAASKPAEQKVPLAQKKVSDMTPEERKELQRRRAMQRAAQEKKAAQAEAQAKKPPQG